MFTKSIQLPILTACSLNVFGFVKSYNFSEDQEKVFRDVISNKHNCLITGSAGSGKSYVLKALKEYFGAKMALTSTTGISSLNVGGQTLHSF